MPLLSRRAQRPSNCRIEHL